MRCHFTVLAFLGALITTSTAFKLTCYDNDKKCELVNMKAHENDKIGFPMPSAGRYVRRLDIKRSNFTYFPGNLFDVMPSLEDIAARCCYIEELTSVFGPTSTYSVDNIRTLRLQENLLKTLEARTFQRTKNLTELVLAVNNITSIDVLAFDGLSSLNLLDLSRNLLTSLDVEVFAPLPSLKTVYLGQNRLHAFNLDAFRHNGGLTYINLVDNYLQTIQATHDNNFIRSVDLRGNNQLIEISALGKMKGMNILQLSDCQNLGLGPTAFSGLEHLIQLRLENVTLQRLNNDFRFLEPLRHLRLLFIGHNDLTSLGAFPNLPNLHGLMLNDNEISTLDLTGLKSQAPKLKEININNNQWDCEVLKDVVGQSKSFSIKLSSYRTDGRKQREGDGKNVEGVNCDDDQISLKNN